MIARKLKNMSLHLVKFKRNEDGAATLEFVILFPLLMTVFLSAYEMGLAMLQNVFVENAADVTVRTLRVAAIDQDTGELIIKNADDLKQVFCDNLIIESDCEESIQVSLEPVSTDTWSPMPTRVQCRNRNEIIDPAVAPNFNTGGENDLMFVSFCVKVKLFFGTSTAFGLGFMRDRTSPDYNIVATTAFVNEPT